MVHLFIALKKRYPKELELRKNLERLIGITSFRQSVDSLTPAEEILAEWDDDLQAFDKARQKYLLYK
jgi:uncharacterized protein YbbC (DUF1343 family)